MPRKPRKTDPRRYRVELKFHEFIPPRTDGLCRCGCGKKPEGRRKTWATDECSGKKLQEYLIAKGNSGAIRRALWARDAGICTRCRLDTATEAAKCMLWKSNATPEARAAAGALRERYMLAGYPSPTSAGIVEPGTKKAVWVWGWNWWEADHIKPVVEGGGHELANLRTLCLVCHKAATRSLAARRGRAGRADTTLPLALSGASRLAASLP